jgi:hypothetical protein
VSRLITLLKRFAIGATMRDQKELVAAYNEFCETNQFKTWYAKFQDLIRTKLEEADTEKKS